MVKFVLAHQAAINVRQEVEAQTPAAIKVRREVEMVMRTVDISFDIDESSDKINLIISRPSVETEESEDEES